MYIYILFSQRKEVINPKIDWKEVEGLPLYKEEEANRDTAKGFPKIIQQDIKLHNFLKKVLVMNPRARITAEEALKDPLWNEREIQK